ncbi:hypothetical protein PV619_003764 [Salmonella enterica]|nr:hypothetical protein [Salmonella enterica]EKM9600776.1 hypothetical protein [Salmonella enterica]
MNNNADVNDTWLVGFSTEISGVEVATHMLISAASLVMAESAAVYMGRTWWAECQEDHEYCWLYPGGVVWFNSIILLDDVENRILRGLKFLDTWIISGTPGSPIIIDDYGESWLNYTR